MFFVYVFSLHESLVVNSYCVWLIILTEKNIPATEYVAIPLPPLKRGMKPCALDMYSSFWTFSSNSFWSCSTDFLGPCDILL